MQFLCICIPVQTEVRLQTLPEENLTLPFEILDFITFRISTNKLYNILAEGAATETDEAYIVKHGVEKIHPTKNIPVKMNYIFIIYQDVSRGKKHFILVQCKRRWLLAGRM